MRILIFSLLQLSRSSSDSSSAYLEKITAESFFSLNNPLILSFLLLLITLSITFIFYKYVILPMRVRFIREKESEVLKHSRLMALFAELDPDPVFRFDFDGNIILSNQAGLKLSGSNYILGKNITSIVPELKEIDLSALIKEEKFFTTTTSVDKRFFQFILRGIPDLLIGQMYGSDVTDLKLTEQKLVLDITERKRAEESLQSSEKKYRDLVENALVGVYTTNLKGDFLYTNDALWKILEYESAAELINVDAKAMYKNIEDRERLIENIKKIGLIINYEIELITKTRKIKNVIISAYLSGDLLTGMIMDITERKLAEEALQESERRYRNLVENAPDVIYSIAEDGSIISLNPAFERITGWSCSEWLGKPFMTLIHPSDLPLAIESFKQSLGGKKQPPYELRVLSKSGEYLVGEFTSTPLIEKGKVVGEFGISRNITERKQTEEIIKESEEKYRLLFENESDAIMILDIETSLFEDMNEASLNLFGYEREEFLKLSFLDISVEPEKSKSAWEATKNSEIQKGTQSVFKKKSGETFIGEISVGTFTSKGKHKTFGVARDISERIRREKKLKNTLENNNQLLKEITLNKKTLQKLSSSLIKVHELERKTISQELHDEIGQTLSAININLASIEKEILPTISQGIKERFKETKELLETVLNQIQEISLKLRPLILDDFGLVPTLRWYISKYIERNNINVDFKVLEFYKRLNPEFELTIYRVVQEALTNVARHSQAKNVKIVMKMRNNCLEILIEDDGIGFNFNEVFDDLTTGRGIGIIHIQERIVSLGGEVNFQTKPGLGTKIIIKLTL